MSETLFLLACAYLGFGIGFAYPATKHACHENAHLGTPNAVAISGLITLVIGVLAWPCFFRRVEE